MADNGIKQRPVRKLTVDNFSVIKHAELEFGKITVLIGPQASGKSLLCKLAYFLGKEVLDLAVGQVANDFDLSELEAMVKKEFFEWFPLEGWGARDWSVQLVLGDYEVTIHGSGMPLPDIDVRFNERFNALFEKHRSGELTWTRREIYADFSVLMGKGVWDLTTYIPSDRPYYVDTNRGYRLLATEPDPIAKRFAESYSNSLNIDIPKPRLSGLLRGEPTRGGNSWLFVFEDGRILPLSHLSSGSKQLLALFSVLETYEERRPIGSKEIRKEITKGIQERIDNSETLGYDEFFVEEPEGDLFPEMQYELVRYFAELASNGHPKPTFTITTHSPYILTAFNNLIEASQVAAAKPELKSEVAKLIPEHYWIKPEDFKAYSINDGRLESIVDAKTGLVSTNYLDQVSETIGVEFDELLRLGYVES